MTLNKEDLKQIRSIIREELEFIKSNQQNPVKENNNKNETFLQRIDKSTDGFF